MSPWLKRGVYVVPGLLVLVAVALPIGAGG
jgi:hypothetical protein